MITVPTMSITEAVKLDDHQDLVLGERGKAASFEYHLLALFYRRERGEVQMLDSCRR